MLHLENPINIMTGGYFSGDTNWHDTHRKSDDCYKIYYIVDGEMWLAGQGENFHLTAGRIYLINGYKIESYGCATRFDVHWLHFVPQNIDTNRALYSLPLVVEISELILQQALRNDIYQDKYKIYDGDDIYSVQQQMKLHHHIQGIIIEALHHYDWSNYSQCKDQDSIAPALSYIEQNYTLNITLKELAAICSLSPNHFHKIFTQALHMTPWNYITQMRMNRALTMIADHNSIKAISYELGYCNDAHFSRTFKKYYGFPPGLYRSSELLSNEFAKQILDHVAQ